MRPFLPLSGVVLGTVEVNPAERSAPGIWHARTHAPTGSASGSALRTWLCRGAWYGNEAQSTIKSSVPRPAVVSYGRTTPQSGRRMENRPPPPSLRGRIGWEG